MSSLFIVSQLFESSLKCRMMEGEGTLEIISSSSLILRMQKLRPTEGTGLMACPALQQFRVLLVEALHKDWFRSYLLAVHCLCIFPPTIRVQICHKNFCTVCLN